MPEEHDALVVGAGVAGLACAQSLAQASVDFLVLEAAHRVGGRAVTDYALADGMALELGALMVHGRKVLTHSWVRELGLETRKVRTLKRGLFSKDGRLASFPSMALPFHPTFGPRAFYQGAYGIPKALQQYAGPDRTLAEFLDELRPLPGARALVTLLFAHAAAADPDEIGVLGPAEEARRAAEEFGYNNFRLEQGYSELARRRAEAFQDRVRLGTRVTTIRYSQDGVFVRAETDGGRTLREFSARCAVLTLPLGVLKAGSVTFDPPLPEEKRRAIDAIAPGQAIVVQLRLRGGNLTQMLGDFAMLWGEGASTFHRPLVELRASAEIICAFTVGREALRRSQLSDEGVVEATVEELRSILPRRVEIGEVSGYAIQRWSTDPHTLCGYSFLPPGVGLPARVALAAPVEGTLFFAGEATHTSGESGTVHGAIETGYRAADSVIHSLRPT